MLRGFVSTKSLTGPHPKLIVSRTCGARSDRDECSNYLAVFGIRDTNYGCQLNRGMRGQSFFDLKRVDILAAY
jgi:hypothetical protein